MRDTNKPAGGAHTPGPWWVCGDKPGETSLLNPVVRANLDGTRRITICRTGQNNHHGYEWANARLIAAAPSLLEALRELLEVCESTVVEDYAQYAAARAAISLATSTNKGEA